MPPPPKYSATQKVALLKTAREMMGQGVTRRHVADQLGLNYLSLNAWLREEALSRIYPPITSPVFRQQ